MQTYKESIANVIVDPFRREILLLQRDNIEGKRDPLEWEFVAGKKETHENIELTLFRETYEETGIMLCKENKNYKFIKKIINEQMGFYVDVYITFINKKDIDIRISKEHRDYLWVELKELTGTEKEFAFGIFNEFAKKILKTSYIVNIQINDTLLL